MMFTVHNSSTSKLFLNKQVTLEYECKLRFSTHRNSSLHTGKLMLHVDVMFHIFFPDSSNNYGKEKNTAYLRIFQDFKQVSCWVSEWNTKM